MLSDDLQKSGLLNNQKHLRVMTGISMLALFYALAAYFEIYYLPGIAKWNADIFLVGIGVAIPFALICEAILTAFYPGNQKRYFFRPVLKVDKQIDEALPQVVASLQERLLSKGFLRRDCVIEAECAILSVLKDKKSNPLSFSDHRFKADFVIKRLDENRSHLEARLEMDDLILFDTGENSNMESFMAELIGLESRPFEKDIPFTLNCGVFLIVGALAFSPFVVGKELMVSGGMGGFILVCFGIYHVLKRRSESHGILLGVLGLLAGAVMMLLR